MTPSGSGVPLSSPYRCTSCSHCANASSSLFSSSVGLRSFVRYPTERVPVGMLNLWRSCLHVSRPLVKVLPANCCCWSGAYVDQDVVQVCRKTFSSCCFVWVCNDLIYQCVCYLLVGVLCWLHGFWELRVWETNVC